MEPLPILLGVFVFVLGTCIGSFLNVVIWRLPYKLMNAQVTFQGKTGRLTLSWPPSHCPNCDTAIPWYLNLPVLGWLIIAGRCATCRKPIAVRYPLVELATGVLFLATYLAYTVGGLRLGLPMAWMGEGGRNGAWVSVGYDWPALALHLFFVAALLAAAAIDADSYIIPISIPAWVAGVAVASAPFIRSNLIPRVPVDQWKWANPILGAAAGLLVANVLLYLRVLPLSFPMPEADAPAEAKKEKKKKKQAGEERRAEVDRQIEKAARDVAESAARDVDPAYKPDAPKADDPAAASSGERIRPLPLASNTLPIVIVTIACGFAAAAGWAFAPAGWAAMITVVAGILIFLGGVLTRDADTPDATADVMDEISAAGARKEILKEILFLLFPVAGAVIAAALPAAPPSDWLGRVVGVLAGFLVGGGSIWAIRILGTLWKGIEAMGLGDVHLMAAAGAVLGPVLVLVAFPMLSPILALGWAAVGYFSRRQTILPFGPWLAMASILALLVGEPIVKWYAQAILGMPAPG